MDAAKRWETEAMRESLDRQRGRPSVSKARHAEAARGEWRTLREATEITGIPIGTLRKWCRRESVDSYLESDGELTLRMVEMGSVKARAEELGRAEGALTSGPADTAASHQPPATSATSSAGTDDAEPAPIVESGTMIVPVDAWNKMLNQLGNLHEAGQQLAEARERAAKAETEAKFLRERLAEMRDASNSKARFASSEHPTVPPIVSSPSGGGGSGAAADGGGQAVPNDHSAINETAKGAEPPNPDEGAEAETTTFWRYVVRGWRGRRT